jgi:hypothetical protein
MNVYRAAMGYGLAVGYRKPEDGGAGQEKAAQGKRAGESGGADSKEESDGKEGER